MLYLTNSTIRKPNFINASLLTFWRPKTSFYDILRVKKNCSSKEIRESYLKLSKLYHPDTTKNSSNAHQHFVKINEAYNTLSKPDLRKNYDQELEYPSSQGMSQNYYQQTYNTSAYDNPIFKRHGSQTYDEDEYYGVKGIKKQPLHIIVFCCICITVVGFLAQVMLIKSSIVFKREQLKRDSEANESLLKEVKRTSELNGRELQIELLKRRVAENEEKRKDSFK